MHQNLLESFYKTLLVSTARVSDSAGLGWGRAHASFTSLQGMMPLLLTPKGLPREPQVCTNNSIIERKPTANMRNDGLS